MVTADGQILTSLARKDFVKAFLIQFGALYIYGLDYEKTKNKKATPKGTRDFFDTCTEVLMKIEPKEDSSGTGVPRKKRTSQGAVDLKKDMKKI